MSCYPPFFYPFGPPYAGDMRAPTPEEYSQMFEPPFPAGSSIGPNTPTGPAGMTGQMMPNTEDMAVTNYLNTVSNRQGYIDNILRMNRGKMARVHMTFNSGGPSSETKVFTGRIETAARDHIIMSDPTTGGRWLLLMVYLDYIEFPEEINYYYPGTNMLHVADQKFLQENPDVMPLFEYLKARREKFIAGLETATAQETT